MATKKSNSSSTAATKREAAKARVGAAKARAGALSGGHAAGFFNFIREQGVVGLAVGLAIGTAAGASVKSIVDNFVSPIVALITQGVELNTLKWVIQEASSDKAEVAIGWGAILSSLITLTATALVIYFVIHAAKLDRINKKKS